MHHRRLSWALTAGLFLTLPAKAHEPTEPEPAREESPGEDSPEEPVEAPYRPLTSGPFVTFTAPITPYGRLVAQPILYLATARGDFDAAGRYQPQAPGESLSTAVLTLFLEYGVLEHVAAGAEVVVQHNRRRSGPDVASSTGPGDVLLFGRGTVLHERAGGPPEVTLLARVKLPTGRAVSARANLLDTDVLGTGSTDLTLGLDFTKGARPFLLHADLLFTYALPTQVDGERVAYGGNLAWSLSGEWPFWENRLALMVEASGRHQGAPLREGQREEDGHADEVLVGAGVELLFSENVQLLVGYQRTVWGRNVRVMDAVVATLIPVVF